MIHLIFFISNSISYELKIMYRLYNLIKNSVKQIKNISNKYKSINDDFKDESIYLKTILIHL